MSKKIDALADWLLEVVEGRQPWVDITEKEPGLSDDDAYRIQHALMARRIAKGDTLVGYKAAVTNAKAQAERGMSGPMVGALLGSAVLPEGPRVPFIADARNAIEGEVGVILKADLPGPNVTPADAFLAIGGYMPAIEVAVQPKGVKRSTQMTYATHKSAGYVIFGGPVTAPHGIDLRTEGMTLYINGEVRATATAAEVLGDPLVSVAEIANNVHKYGGCLKAGHRMITGSINQPIELEPGDDVRIDFTRLGSIGCRFTA